MKKHHLTIALLLTLSTICLTGCPHKEYTLTMSTKDNVLLRKLTVKFVEMDEKEKLETTNRIAELYGQDSVKEVSQEVTFEGQFTDKTPNDIGGNGSVTYDICPYGSITGYVENFGGSDDLYEQVKTRTDAGDELIDILRLTLKQKFTDMDEFPKLEKFIDMQLREDCKTLLLLLWTTQNQLAEVKQGFPEPSDKSKKDDTTLPDPEKTTAARLVQFLLGHNYISNQKVSLLLCDTIVSNSSKPTLYAEVLRYALVEKVGLKKDGQLTDAIVDFIINSEKDRLETFREAAKSTKGFREFKKQYLRKQTAKPVEEKEEKKSDDSENTNQDIAGEYTSALLSSVLGYSDGVSDKLTASLTVPCKPLYTNGKWYEDKKLVAWYGTVENDKLQAPAICYTLWVEPDETAQTKQFGKIFLNEHDLMTYIAWSKGLAPDEAAQWNDFVRTLNNKNIETILEFKFKGKDAPAFHEHQTIAMFYKAVTGKDVPSPVPNA